MLRSNKSDNAPEVLARHCLCRRARQHIRLVQPRSILLEPEGALRLDSDRREPSRSAGDGPGILVCSAGFVGFGVQRLAICAS